MFELEKLNRHPLCNVDEFVSIYLTNAQINLYRYAAGDSLCHTNIVSCNDLLKLRALV